MSRRSRRELVLRREENRSLLLLGLLGVLITYRVTAVQPATEFSVLGVPLVLAPILDALLWLWGGYALCMLVYFSDDVFSGRLGTQIRRIAYATGLELLFFFPVFFLSTIALVVLAVNLPAGVVEFVFVAYAILVIVGLAALLRKIIIVSKI